MFDTPQSNGHPDSGSRDANDSQRAERDEERRRVRILGAMLLMALIHCAARWTTWESGPHSHKCCVWWLPSDP